MTFREMVRVMTEDPEDMVTVLLGSGAMILAVILSAVIGG